MARDRIATGAYQRTYLITGACGGLGSSLTTMLAKRGARVFAVDFDREALTRFHGESAIHPLCVDVAQAGSVASARAEIEKTESALDGIVCAAGVYVGGPLLALSEDHIRSALEANLIGAVSVVRQLYPLLRKGSRIVLISSESTRVALPFTGPYAISKAALETYADTLRRELLPLGVRVTVIQPGAIRTRLLETAARSLDPPSTLEIYRRGLDSAASVLEKSANRGLEPDRVAALIARVLESRRPLRLKRIGNDPARAFLSLLPACLIDALVRTFL